MFYVCLKIGWLPFHPSFLTLIFPKMCNWVMAIYWTVTHVRFLYWTIPFADCDNPSRCPFCHGGTPSPHPVVTGMTMTTRIETHGSTTGYPINDMRDFGTEGHQSAIIYHIYPQSWLVKTTKQWCLNRFNPIYIYKSCQTSPSKIP